MRRYAAVLATVLTLGGAAYPAHADSGSTLYVNGTTGSGCSDTDPATGSEAVPYCTLQTAVDAAQPGQTVQIAAGAYPPLHITHSGTAAQPIVLRGVLNPTPFGDTDLRAAPNTTGLDVDGASYVSISQLVVESSNATTTVHIHESDHIALDDVRVIDSGEAPALDIDASNDTTVRRTSTSNGPVLVHNQAQNTQLLTDEIFQSISSDAAVVVDGAAGTLLRNDTVATSLGGGVSVRGGATGTRIDDSVLADSRGGPEMSVAADSTSETTEQYDVLQPLSGQTPYQWGGTPYSTQAAFAQATGQGAHDCAGVCGVAVNTVGLLTEYSPAIDSEDPSVVSGLPAIDVLGNSRVADPLVDAAGGSTGPVDRGAFEFTDPIHEVLTYVPDVSGPLSAPSTGVLQATLANPWGDQVTPAQYSFLYGDGTGGVSGPNSQVAHTYQAGLWSPQVTMTSTTGATYGAFTNIDLSSPPPLTTSIDLGTLPTAPLSAAVDVRDQVVNGWPVTGRTVDWGDSSPVQNLGFDSHTTHTYPRPGAWTVTETTTDAHGRTAKTTKRLVTGSAFVPHAPLRLLDTRTTTGGHHGVVAAGGTIFLKVTGVTGIPTSGVTAVTLNLTSANPSGAGYLTAYSSTGAKPTASSVNFAAHENRSNLVTVPVGPDGRIRISASTRTDVVADLSGYYRTGGSVPSGTFMEPLTSPDRVLDTRQGIDVPVKPGQVVKVQLPKSVTNVSTAVVLNVTAVSPSANGFVTAYGAGPVPATSSINFSAGQTTAGEVVVSPAADGTVSLYNRAGSVHLLVDLEGSFDPAAGLAFVPAGPTRLLDTRTSGGPMHSGQQITISPAAFPSDAKAVLLNLTETQAQGSGYLALGTAPSTLNFAKGQTSSNLALANLMNGLPITDRSAGVQAIADLQGWFG